MIRFGKLTHDAFTLEELNDLLAPHLPYSHALSLPIGKGKVEFNEAQVTLDATNNLVNVQLWGDLQIEVLGIPLYRAHILVTFSAHPEYISGAQQVKANDVKVDHIRLVQDAYTFVQDADTILAKFIPLPGAKLLSGPMRGMMSLASAGLSESAISYLQLFMKGNAQQVLNYHLPQLNAFAAELAREDVFVYDLDHNDWRELLFMQKGKDVVVEGDELWFRF